MKTRRIILAAAAALIYTAAMAVPAKPGAFNYTQPDGTVIQLELHGDEFFNWHTLAGTSQVMVKGDDGFWHKGSLNTSAMQAARRQRRSINLNRTAGLRTHNNDPMTHGERHIPVFLVNFSDLSFKISDPQAKFNALLNQKGYSYNGGTGSVQDYYVDNSHGAFTPIFDVFGPVTLPNTMAYYGAPASESQSDTCPEVAVYEAAMALDGEIDFSRYDYNNDGMVDMILMYYAGYNQAEHGPDDSIWPHQWSVQNSSNRSARNARPDGKALGAYFCTSELSGSYGTTMCGIGTTCHEFGHSLGLPDFYDTDYEDNGYSGALYSFSTMCSGSYNNNGRTPPYFNSEERIILGWLMDSDVPDLPEGQVSFSSVKDDYAFRTVTDTDGEYFLYECRDGSGWDAYIPSGLLVYHVDKSTVHNVGGISAHDHWYYWNYYNSINAFGSHPCFYVIPASDQSSLYFTGNSSQAVFPGTRRITSYSPIDWDKRETGVSISGISYSNGKVSLTATYSNERTVYGTVTGQNNKPISGVRVTIGQKSNSVSPSRIIPRGSGSLEAVTDDQGSFVISLDGFSASSAHITFSKDGYKTIGKDITLGKRSTEASVVLQKNTEGEIKDFYYFDPNSQMYFSGEQSLGNSQMAAIRIPASQLPQNGGTVLSVSFYPYLQASSYYIIVDAGSTRVFTGKIPGLTGGENYSKYYLGDITNEDVEFPGGTDLYVGIAVQNASAQYSGYPFIVGSGSGSTYYSAFNLNSSNWAYKEEDGYSLVLSTEIAGKEAVDEPVDDPVEDGWSLAKMGFNSIADPGNGQYTAGSSFPLNLSLRDGLNLVYVTWTFDGKDVSGAKSVTLTAGTHDITAKASYSDGSKETLQLILDVK